LLGSSEDLAWDGEFVSAVIDWKEQASRPMKLMEALEILRRPQSREVAPFITSLVCGFNALHFQTFLSAELRCRNVERRTEISTGLYGDFWGNLDRLPGTDRDAVVIVLEWPDLDPRLGIRSLGSWAPSVIPELIESAKRRCRHLEDAIQSLASRSLVAVCFPTLPLPPVAFTPGWQASALEVELKSCLADLGAQLGRKENVRVLSQQRLDELSPLGERLDARADLMTGFPYQLKHASILAELLALLCGDGAPKKGLITDLDDTLWEGILGEIGPEGVSWDLDHHSHIHGAYQRMLHSLSEAGILIGVASKNDPALVAKAFERQDLVLPQESVFPMEVHWGAKSESVARIMKAWNIGPEAIVFIDDSPAELAEVRFAHPQVECLRFPAHDPQRLFPLLQRLRDLFGKTAINGEDGIRMQSIRRSREFQEHREIAAGSPDSFLREAGAQLDLSFTKEPLDPRALELINKTNQFNLNGRRYTSAEWRRFVLDPATFLLLVNYKDKYGSLGKIAVITGRQEGSKLVIDNWVMSCRAFGRRIEYACLEALYDKFGAAEIELEFEATERNDPLKTFLQEMLGTLSGRNFELSREKFLERSPETFHLVADVSRG
jgi:FkbH-like protein